MADAKKAPVPETIGRYSVVLPIASGGMATVYLAKQHGLAGFGRDVAVKLMHGHLRDDEHWTLEFLEEAKLAARIRHPNVVQVIDVGEDPLGTFLVMDYVEGETLAGLARFARKENRPMPRPIALRILHDVLLGLHAAHELKDDDGASMNVVHRDFSPQNVLVGTDGIARLTDFGIAKAVSRLTFTRTGTVKGKVAYMSPEQARGASVDRRCDVWAAGVVAWEVLANQRLYSATEDLSVGLRILTERPQLLTAIDPSIPHSVAEAVASALEPDLDARCPTAAELARRLVEGQELADLATVSRYVDDAANTKLGDRRARVALAAKTREPSVPVEVIELPTNTSGSADIASKPRRGRLPWLVLAGASAILAIVFASTRSPRESAKSDPVASAPSPVLSISQQPAPSAETSKPGYDVELTSDVALAACRIAGRPVVPEAPTTKLVVQITEAESAKSIEVTAIAADGRRSVEKLSPGARALKFRFEKAVVTKPVKPVATAKPAVTAAKPGLADDPYGGK